MRNKVQWQLVIDSQDGLFSRYFDHPTDAIDCIRYWTETGQDDQTMIIELYAVREDSDGVMQFLGENRREVKNGIDHMRIS